MSGGIECLVPEYRDGTPEKSCGNCIMHERHLANGLLCEYNDKATSAKKVCGWWLTDHSDETATKPAAEQLDLF